MGISRRGKRARSEEVRIAEGDTKQDGAGKAQPLIPCAVPRIPPRAAGGRLGKRERSKTSENGTFLPFPDWALSLAPSLGCGIWRL